MDNNEERMVIPHGPAAENSSNETPNKVSNFSSDQDSDTQSTQSTPEPITDTVISHEEPIEQPSTAPSDTEPVDIFATPEEQAAEPTAITGSSTHLNNTPFNSRNRYQEQSHNGFNNVPQFFSDAISANTPIEQPKRSKKGLIIGLTISVLAIAGIVTLVLFISGRGLLPMENKDPDTIPIASDDLKNKFNSYLNYFGYGKNSTDKPDMKAAREQKYTYYAVSVINGTTKVDNKDAYFEELNNKFSAFIQKYEEEFSASETGYIRTYFYAIPSMELPNYEELFYAFQEEGYDKTKNDIDKKIEILKNYQYANNYKTNITLNYESYLDLFKYAKNKKCLQSTSPYIIEDCLTKNSTTTKLSSNIAESQADVLYESNQLLNNAIREIGNYYDTIYPPANNTEIGNE